MTSQRTLHNEDRQASFQDTGPFSGYEIESFRPVYN
jgi:hypothetical protein